MFTEREATIEFLDVLFQPSARNVQCGITARVILHEYDHIDGAFIDLKSLLKEKLLKRS